MVVTPICRVGHSIPDDTEHALSVSLPTWESNVSYEENEENLIKSLETGYPRFFLHKSIQRLVSRLTELRCFRHTCLSLFHSEKAALECLEYVQNGSESFSGAHVEILRVNLRRTSAPNIVIFNYPPQYATLLKSFWQHTGCGISSRLAEVYVAALRVETFDCTQIAPLQDVQRNLAQSQVNYRRTRAGLDHECLHDTTSEGADFVEERFGRVTDNVNSFRAIAAIKQRIVMASRSSAQISVLSRVDERLSIDDIYLYPCGMNAIYNVARTLMEWRPYRKSVVFGFPYIDTLKVLQRFGPGCLFYGHGSHAELDDLEARCVRGEKFLGLFCEFPGNPLLKTPPLERIARLAKQFGFVVVVDETIGNFENVQILTTIDIVVSSLTKVFAGEGNVMGGSPYGQFYADLKTCMRKTYEDNYWYQDLLQMERNSRDFASRIQRIDANTAALCNILLDSPAVKRLHYPKFDLSRSNYETYKSPYGGHGGLLSIIFSSTEQAIIFYDTISTAKGPSLGTNFTLCSPYVMLAHYRELSWALQFGVESSLVRISVGLEALEDLLAVVREALSCAETRLRLEFERPARRPSSCGS